MKSWIIRKTESGETSICPGGRTYVRNLGEKIVTCRASRRNFAKAIREYFFEDVGRYEFSADTSGCLAEYWFDKPGNHDIYGPNVSYDIMEW